MNEADVRLAGIRGRVVVFEDQRRNVGQLADGSDRVVLIGSQGQGSGDHGRRGLSGRHDMELVSARIQGSVGCDGLERRIGESGLAVSPHVDSRRIRRGVDDAHARTGGERARSTENQGSQHVECDEPTEHGTLLHGISSLGYRVVKLNDRYKICIASV
jgi:hypothetical protein